MRRRVRILLILFIFLASLFQNVRTASADWDPVTDGEKAMKTNPLDPGSGAVVLFKRGEVEVLERNSSLWTTRILTYARIKVFTDAGREAANVSVDSPKWVRLAKVEGRTILPSGEIIPLDSSKVFRGKAYEAGKNFAILKTSFTFPSVEPGAIFEYQMEEDVDWYFPPPWIFDTPELGTLQSSLKVVVGSRLIMAQFPLDTTLNKIEIAQKQIAQATQFDFSVKNLHPIQREPFALPYRDLSTMVIFTPREIEFSGRLYPILEKWDDLANEITSYNTMEKSDKDAKNKTKELTDNLPDPRKKAEAIYKYIQQNITSSNISGVALGRTADEILKDKRGDPDEINALFVSMLKGAKVDADMVLVATQNWQTLVRGFPNYSQFSRIITRVNFKDGPVFADASDPAAAFGELPWFDRGILGLAIKGSKIQEASIPTGTPDDNLSVEKTSLQIAKDWSAEGDTEINLKGAEAIDFRDDLLDESPDKAEQTLTDYFAYGHSDAEISQIVHPDLKDSSQPLALKAHLREKLNNESGPGELLVNPWLDDQYERPLFKASVRHSAVRFNTPEKRVSTSTWQLAPEIKVVQIPKDVKIENDLGGFSHSCTQDNTTVTCTRTYYLKKMLLQTTAEYLSARKFFDDIAKNDQEVIILRGQ
jgi:transglutaminase-like putative cysteine protease